MNVPAGDHIARKGEKNANSFEQDLHRLEEIVSRLETGLPIEDAIAFYQEGMKLSRQLEERLTDIERKVYEVKNSPKLATGEDTEPEIGLFQIEDKQP